MRIAVVHNAVYDDSSPDERDVLVQADAVIASLKRLGHETVRLDCDLDLSAIKRRIGEVAPQLVFNLVESLAGTGRLIHLFPSLLEALAVPFTGASAETLFLTSNKTLAKVQMRAADLNTPDWVGPLKGRRPQVSPVSGQWPRHWIIKSVWEHASIGIDEQALLDGVETPRLNALLAERAAHLGGGCFAEAFIEGREFNLSVLDGPRGPVVLPPAEIIFEGFGDNQPRIVGYQAKWNSDSFAYHHTPRRFDFDSQDGPLLERLESMALRCWELFDLRGYARVDFRVDADRSPWVLEINANPCLSPDAGFAAALERAGLQFEDALARIVVTCGV
ncbi:MAG: D-alanine--D-alanine ligase [Desulfobacterales bacterium]